MISALLSKKQFKYGYFECRAKAPSGRGFWPGFWLYGGHPNDEIDFMEMKGEKSKHAHVDVHCPDNCDKVPKNWIGFKKIGEDGLKPQSKLLINMWFTQDYGLQGN